jgi:hypothetical protein
MLSLRHMETRLLDRIEDLAGQVSQLNEKVAASKNQKPAKASARPNRNSGAKKRKQRASTGLKGKGP